MRHWPTLTPSTARWHRRCWRGCWPTRPCSTAGWARRSVRSRPPKRWRSLANSTTPPCWSVPSPRCCGTTAFDAEQAATYFAEAIELARALGDKWRLSRLLGFQAYAAAVTGDAKAARAAGEEGRDLADAIGDQFSSFQCRVWGIAAGRAGLGDLPGADAEFREMLADTNAAGDSLVRFHGLMTQSFALGWQGKTAAARAAAEAAIESAAELGVVIEGLGLYRVGCSTPGRGRGSGREGRSHTRL